MVHKFCDNHLADLYDAIKSDNIPELEKVEHELTSQEECVACTYAFKAKGSTKEVLLSYLKSEGLGVDIPVKENAVDHFYYWFVRVAVFLGVCLALFSFIRFAIPFPWSVFLPTVISAGAVIIFVQIFG